MDSKGPGSPGGTSTEVASATRNAVVAYAKQFLGNPYVYGGTSLTSGADCSGFTQSVFAHFGISTGRSSRDQAARGKSIPVSDAKPGDLLFYASGDYINMCHLHRRRSGYPRQQPHYGYLHHAGKLQDTL